MFGLGGLRGRWHNGKQGYERAGEAVAVSNASQ